GGGAGRGSDESRRHAAGPGADGAVALGGRVGRQLVRDRGRVQVAVDDDRRRRAVAAGGRIRPVAEEVTRPRIGHADASARTAHGPRRERIEAWRYSRAHGLPTAREIVMAG